MEGRTFDQITRMLAGGTSRRGLVRRLVGVGAAAGVVGIDHDHVGAQAGSQCARELPCTRYGDRRLRASCIQACQRCQGDTSQLCRTGESTVVCCPEGTFPCSGGFDCQCCESAT
jgi:hypothetical protein